MSRTNISILLATALLGVLLYVVRQIVADQPVEPVQVPVSDTETEEQLAEAVSVAREEAVEAGIPVLDGPESLRRLLEARGLDADASLEATQDWFESRGFRAGHPMVNLLPAAAEDSYYESLDLLTLESMSEGGDMQASHALAARQRLTDPFAALDSLSLAAEQGSVNAFFQAASLQETLAQIRPGDFASDPEFSKKLRAVSGRDGELGRQLAFMNGVTGLRDGGAAIADPALLAWVTDMETRLPPGRELSVCNDSLAQFLNLSNRRRSRGLPPLNVDPPPVFLALPELEEELPCRDSLNPIVSNQLLDDCAVEEVVNATGDARLLHICARP